MGGVGGRRDAYKFDWVGNAFKPMVSDMSRESHHKKIQQ